MRLGLIESHENSHLTRVILEKISISLKLMRWDWDPTLGKFFNFFLVLVFGKTKKAGVNHDVRSSSSLRHGLVGCWLRLPQVETKTTRWQQQQRNAKTLALPAPRQRLQCGIVIMAQATRAAVVALFLVLFLFLRAMGSCCPLSSGRGYWCDGHLRCRGHLCWHHHPTSGDKDGQTMMTTMLYNVDNHS